MWEDWLHEEIIASKTDEQKKEVLKLFQKALEDLLCNSFKYIKLRIVLFRF